MGGTRSATSLADHGRRSVERLLESHHYSFEAAIGQLNLQVLEVSISGGSARCETRQLSFLDLNSLTGLHARDLWSLQEHSSEAGRALIQPRGRNAILLRMGMVRAVLTAERCLLF